DTFYYIYGVFHSPIYREKYSNDLKKGLPRIPVLKNKEKYVEIGRKLADLHLNYENVDIYNNINIESNPAPSYYVSKMRHPKKNERDKIIYNKDITISNIPEKAYKYIVNGRSAIEWIIDQYQVKTDKKSGIIDDPNMFSHDEKYILHVLLRIINLSIQTIELIDNLPTFEIDDNKQ